jgi:hypothetical protein
MKIIVKPESLNLWWGIYGLTEKIGWEDLNIFNENGELIGRFCLNTKKYLRTHLNDLKSDPNEVEFAQAVENYLSDNKFHYWYYYDKKGDEDFYEVPYEFAPKNEEGVKPGFIDIWHPDENIGISTIETTVKEFVGKFLNQEITNIIIENAETFEESIMSFEENEKLFGRDKPVNISLSEELINELSHHWKMPKDDVLSKLKKGIK